MARASRNQGEITMTVMASRAKPRRTAIGAEEDRAWVSFYQRARKDPAIAEEVLAQLDTDAEMKRQHLALYLCCRESLRLNQARQARNQRIGRFVRWMFGGVFIRLPATLRRGFGHGGDMALACLPEANVEPATAQVRRLASSPKVRAARTAFKPRAKTEPLAPATAPSEALPQAAQAGG
jgi:hypothetical protein